MKREELEGLEKIELIEIILSLVECMSALEAQLKQNSSNSSKPPSSDVWKLPKSQRKNSGAKPGGQPGHKGNFLKIEREPDETIKIKPRHCGGCGRDLSGDAVTQVETRHKIDVEIKTKTTTYEQYEVICPCCGRENRESFPESVKSHVSYGEGVQSMGVLLTGYMNASYDKTATFMNDVLEIPISAGTLVNHSKEFVSQSEPVLSEIKTKVQQSEVGNFDETSVRVNGANQWLHTAGSSEATYNTVHPKRGKDGTNDNGVLKNFTGVAVHDCLIQYYSISVMATVFMRFVTPIYCGNCRV